MKPTVVARARQGMTPTVEDADVLARIAAIIRVRNIPRLANTDDEEEEEGGRRG